MNSKKNFRDKIVKDIQSCFKEMNLEILDVEESRGNYVIKSEVDFLSFKMNIVMTYLIKKEIVAVIIEFTRLIPGHRFNDIYDITNRINTMLMDIGHFKLSPKTGKILLCTGVDVANGFLDICQFEELIKRIIGQAEICYEIITRVAFDNICPEEAWRDCMCQLHYSVDNENPTLH
jgi:hypothetical protein